MSFEQQQTNWSCGLAALRYAYSLLGGGLRRSEELTEQNVLAKARKTRWRVFRDGTSESDIVRAAKSLGLVAKIRRFTRRNPEGAVESARAATAKGRVAIACVHSETELFFHWIVIANFRGDKAIVFDPAVTDAGLDERTYWLGDPAGDYVPGLMSVSRLQEWLDPGEDLAMEAAESFGEQHLFIEVSVARDHRARFVPGIVDEALVRRMRRDLDLAASFDEYVDDLRSMFGHPGVRRHAGGDPAHRFLRRNRERLVELVTSWVAPSACNEGTVRRELENLEAISRCYSFIAKRGHEPAVLANVAFWLGWASATCAYKVGKFAA